MPPTRRSVALTASERRRHSAIHKVFHATGTDYTLRKLRKGWIGQSKLLRKYNNAASVAGRRRVTWRRLSR